MYEAPPSRYDYRILSDYDHSGTTSRNRLEYSENILLLTNRITTDREPFFQNLLDDTVYNSLLMVWTRSRSTVDSTCCL